MSLSPVAFIAPNYRDYKGYWIKFYEPRTTTPKPIYTNSNATDSAVKLQLNSDGFIIAAGDVIITPYIDGAYDAYLFIDADSADNNETGNAVRVANDISGASSGYPVNVDSVEEMKATLSLSVGQKASCDRFYQYGDFVEGMNFDISATGTGDDFTSHQLDNGLFANLIFSDTLNAAQVGAVGDGANDDGAAIQAAIDALPVNLAGGGTVELISFKSYIHSTSILIPSNITLNCKGAITRYTGTDKAFIIGESLVALNYDSKLLNMVCLLQDKTSIGVYLRNTAQAEVTGYMEGLYQPFDNTRTNIGIWIDGGNVSSFFNRIETRLNHIHEGYRLKTTGNRQSTQHMFDNCSILADQDTDDLSVGYNIGPSDNGAVQEGQGTVINGGNIEKCQTGFIHGPKAGRFTLVGVRTEIVIKSGAWKFKIFDGAEPLTLIGINGLGTTYMESASGITGWSFNQNVLIGGDAGETRLGGFSVPLNGDNTFLGLGSDNPQIWTEGDSDLNFLSDSDAAGTGRFFFQVGKGSASHGGGMAYHGNAHATSAGEVHIFPAPNKGAKFYNGLGGAVTGEFRTTGAANTTSLWLLDVSAGSLKQVSLGASSGGFRPLRVAG